MDFKKVLFVLFFGILVIFSGCSTTDVEVEQEVENQTKESKDISVVASFYPVAEISEAVTGDKVNVLVPAGAEPHSYEPTAVDIVKFSEADVFVSMGGIFESIENKVVDSNSNIKVIEATHNLELIKGEEHKHGEHNEESHEDENHKEGDKHEEEHESHEDEHHDVHENEEEMHKEEHEEDGHHDEHNHGEFDPHVWLSIHNMQKMTKEVEEHLVELYPQNKETYEANAKAYLEKLEVLEEEFKTGLANCSKDVILVNHKAFGYLAHEHGFEQISVAGFAPEVEPTVKSIQNLIEEAKYHNVSYVFAEGQVDSKVVETIASDLNGEVLNLYPVKMTQEEDYFSIMRTNLESLRIGLECE